MGWAEIEDQHAELLPARTVLSVPSELNLISDLNERMDDRVSSDNGLSTRTLDTGALAGALTGGRETGND